MTPLLKFSEIIAERPERYTPSGKSLTQRLLNMEENRESKSGNELVRRPIITIDDLAKMAEDLLIGILQLSEYKYPLDIRRGSGLRRGVNSMVDQNESSRTLKAGSKTYFFDIRKTKEGKPYLVITESRLKEESGSRERHTIIVFPEEADSFAETVSEMVKKLT
jgi:hypothetical protein